MTERRRIKRLPFAGPAAAVAWLVVAITLGPSSPMRSIADHHQELERAAAVDPLMPDTTLRVPLTTTSTTLPPTTTTTAAPPPPTTTTTTAAPKPQRFTLEPYRGLGAWLDVYDWSTTYAKYGPALEPTAVDALAASGVQTLFIQASKWDSPTDVVDPDRLRAFIDRAHQHHISVVGWYLPTLEDTGRDLARLRAIVAMPVDGLAVDIEARNVRDVGERNRRAVILSQALRNWYPGEVLGAIPLEPVLLEDVNPNYWPHFPWAGLAPIYDVWMPMGYWTNRRGGWRDAYTYTAENIDRLRKRVGNSSAPVHALGGIGDTTSVADLQGFWIASSQRGVIGGSIYDFRTTQGPHWPQLLKFRTLRP